MKMPVKDLKGGAGTTGPRDEGPREGFAKKDLLDALGVPEGASLEFNHKTPTRGRQEFPCHSQRSAGTSAATASTSTSSNKHSSASISEQSSTAP